MPEVSRERDSSDAPLVKPLASLALNSTASPITPRSQALSDQAQGAIENSPSVHQSTSKRPPMLRISPSKSGLSPSDDLAFAKAHSSTTANAMRCSTFGSPATPCSRMRPPHAVAPNSPISPSTLSLPTPSNRAYGSPGTPEYNKASVAHNEHDARPRTPHACPLFEAQQVDSTRTSSRPVSADKAPQARPASNPPQNNAATVSVSQTHAGPPSPGGKITHVSTRHYKLSPRQAACDKDRRERRGDRSPSPHPLASPHRNSLSPTQLKASGVGPQSPTIKAENAKYSMFRNAPAASVDPNKGHSKDDAVNAKADPSSTRPPPSPLGHSERRAPLGNSERRPLVSHSRVFGSHPAAPAPANKQSDSRNKKPVAQPATAQIAAQAMHAKCEGKGDVPPAKELSSARMARRSVLSWGRSSQAVKQSVAASTAVAEDAFHLKTASPLAESASRMSTGGSAETGSQSARQ